MGDIGVHMSCLRLCSKLACIRALVRDEMPEVRKEVSQFLGTAFSSPSFFRPAMPVLQYPGRRWLVMANEAMQRTRDKIGPDGKPKVASR